MKRGIFQGLASLLLVLSRVFISWHTQDCRTLGMTKRTQMNFTALIFCSCSVFILFYFSLLSLFTQLFTKQESFSRTAPTSR